MLEDQVSYPPRGRTKLRSFRHTLAAADEDAMSVPAEGADRTGATKASHVPPHGKDLSAARLVIWLAARQAAVRVMRGSA